MTEAPVIAPLRGRYRVGTPAEVLACIQQRVRIDEDGCHIWAGATSGSGAPFIHWMGARRNARALLIELSGRQIYEGWVTWAVCGKRMCMHADHVRAGTRSQCMQAKARAGLLPHGRVQSIKIAAAVADRSRMPMSARFEVARMRAEGCTWQQVGDRFGVHFSAPQKQLKRWERIFGPAAYWTTREAA
jgi:hypothetical protein